MGVAQDTYGEQRTEAIDVGSLCILCASMQLGPAG